MTKDEAITELEIMLGRELDSAYKENCTGNYVETCPNDECMICGVKDCPDNEPLHHHHDGCPCCWNK